MKPGKLFLLLFLVISHQLYSQENHVIHEQRVYKNIDDMALVADMFFTETSLKNSSNPAIAFFHGGGWAYGNPSEFFETCKRYAQKGFITFSFTYRLSVTEEGTVPHPGITPVESSKDARTAIRWIRENATKLYVDPNRIVVSGQSAGGQLALATALLDNVNESTDNLNFSPTPNALVLFSSNLNTVEPWVDWLLDDRRNEIWSVSPFHNIKAGMPPAIEFHGTKDPQVPWYTVEFFMKKTRLLGNHFEQVPFEGKGHYLGEGNEKYARYFDEEILERVDKFLEKFGFFDK